MLCVRNSGEGPSEASSPMEGGSGGPPPEIFPKLDCKWCNQSYYGASFVNKKKIFFFLLFFLFRIRSSSGFPEQLAAMLLTPLPYSPCFPVSLALSWGTRDACPSCSHSHLAVLLTPLPHSPCFLVSLALSWGTRDVCPSCSHSCPTVLLTPLSYSPCFPVSLALSWGTRDVCPSCNHSCPAALLTLFPSISGSVMRYRRCLPFL